MEKRKQDVLRRVRNTATTMARFLPQQMRSKAGVAEVSRIERRHLPMLVHRTGARRNEEFSTLQHAREAYEREYILRKIDECHGNMSRAAESLGLERSHLYRKMRTLGISVRE